jgi:hypothetical protein
LEEHIKDARRRQVTGMEIWRKAGFDEYSIPIKVANNKYFIKQSKMPHSKLSIDTRRRVEDAAMISSSLGTYITTQNCGPYVTKWQLVKKADKQKELMNPHMEDFDTCPYIHENELHLERPTVRQLSEYGQDERLRKEEVKRELADFPNMVANPFITYSPSGKVFDLPTLKYTKIFTPARKHHTHFPRTYGDEDHHSEMPIDHGSYTLDRDHEPHKAEANHYQEHVKFQKLMTKKRLSSMKINRRHSRRDSHVS